MADSEEGEGAFILTSRGLFRVWFTSEGACHVGGAVSLTAGGRVESFDGLLSLRRAGHAASRTLCTNAPNFGFR